jgi:hypothetical protein
VPTFLKEIEKKKNSNVFDQSQLFYIMGLKTLCLPSKKNNGDVTKNRDYEKLK